MTLLRRYRIWLIGVCCLAVCVGFLSGAARAATPLPERVTRDSPAAQKRSYARRAQPDSLETARAALRTLQFDKAISLLSTAAAAGNADATCLLGLIYLNGVGTARDQDRALTLLRAAAEHGQPAAAYVLAGELARAPGADPSSWHQWLERAANQGYVRAVEVFKSGRPPLDREWTGAADPALLTAWVLDRARRDDAGELRRIGARSVSLHDEFGRSALSYAAESGSLAAATALLELGAVTGEQDRAGTTALMIAASQAHPAVVSLLLQHGADSRAADNSGRTALFYAARANQPAIVRVLFEAGVKLDVEDERGYNALDDALTVDAADAAGELRSLGVRAHVVAVGRGRQTGQFDPVRPGDLYRGWPPIALAVARNDTATVRQLLDAGANANQHVPQGDSLLQIAADSHALESLALLLSHAGNPAGTDRTGHTVLWIAANRGDLPVVKAILAEGVSPDVHADTEKAPLLAALDAEHVDIALALLNSGANLDATDAEGRTALILASAAGATGLVKALLAKGARTGAEDREHRTALWYAASVGSLSEIDALLSAGGIQAVTDVHGLSILHAAALQPDPAVLAPLLALVTRVNEQNLAGDTPLMVAAARGHTDMVRAILARTPDLNAQNKAGDTALIAASRGGHAAICRLLIRAGANPSLRNSSGRSAADVALDRGFASIASELTVRS